MTRAVYGRCWLWPGYVSKKGYARTSLSRSRHGYVHRFVYEAIIGPIPPGLEIDHLCGNESCYNPAHLEAVTHAENVKRGGNSVKTHCKWGHEFTEENTYWWRGHRKCRICIAESSARQNAKLLAQRKAKR